VAAEPDPFAGLPRLTPFVYDDDEDAGGPPPATAPTDARPAGRHAGTGSRPAAASGGRRRRRDDAGDNDVLSQILRRERGQV
jgi:hypothetical protein